MVTIEIINMIIEMLEDKIPTYDYKPGYKNSGYPYAVVTANRERTISNNDRIGEVDLTINLFYKRSETGRISDILSYLMFKLNNTVIKTEHLNLIKDREEIINSIPDLENPNVLQTIYNTTLIYT